MGGGSRALEREQWEGKGRVNKRMKKKSQDLLIMKNWNWKRTMFFLY